MTTIDELKGSSGSSAVYMLARDLPFAKLVATPEGDALLIGGTVYRVTGPDGNAAGLFSKALRAGQAQGSSLGADYAAQFGMGRAR